MVRTSSLRATFKNVNYLESRRVRIPPSPLPARGLFTSITKYIRFQSKVYPKFLGDLKADGGWELLGEQKSG